jgi:hypothetical protein
VHTPSWARIYAWLWAVTLVIAPAVCIRGLIKPPSPRVLGPSSRVFILGFLVSALLFFTLLTTTLRPLAAASFFAPLIFAVAVFRPTILYPKGPRIYLIACMAVAEVFWIWMSWSQFS